MASTQFSTLGIGWYSATYYQWHPILFKCSLYDMTLLINNLFSIHTTCCFVEQVPDGSQSFLNTPSTRKSPIP
ncbi:hypothetical protein ABKN59_007889 [Abortiporus biennis]